MENQRRWLLEYFESITVPQWFFLGFGALTFLFVRLMYGHYERSTQSKFKKEESKKQLIKKP